MELLPYDPAMAEQVAAAYNEAVRGIPHCYPVSVKDWSMGLAMEHDLRDREAFVATEGGSILGFMHAGIGHRERGESPEIGLIQFFWYAPGHREAGQTLLERAEYHLWQHGMHKVVAFHQNYRYPFYHLGSAYMSDRLGHVAALLGLNGYRHIAGEVYMDWPNLNPGEPAPAEVPADIALVWEPGRGARPGLVLRAFQSDEWAGVCKCASCAEYSRADEAQDWFFTTWLNVREDLQRKGLGRHLLQRALAEMVGVGYRHACISTARHNFRAALFYSNLGYRVVDWTYGLGRALDAG